jgi:hypothetical protein
MDAPIKNDQKSGVSHALTDEEIHEGFRLLDLESEGQRRALRDSFGAQKQDAPVWGDLVTRSNAEQSECVERFRAQLQSNTQ